MGDRLREHGEPRLGTAISTPALHGVARRSAADIDDRAICGHARQGSADAVIGACEIDGDELGPACRIGFRDARDWLDEAGIVDKAGQASIPVFDCIGRLLDLRKLGNIYSEWKCPATLV